MYKGHIPTRRLSHIERFTRLVPTNFGFHSRHYLAILFLVTVGSYYRIIFHGDFINLDDMAMMKRLLNSPPLALNDLFFPGGAAKYYRPVVELSYRLDHFLWFDVASGWYLTNVLLHLLNSFFVYLIALRLFSRIMPEKEIGAFFSALLFAVNPLTSESVCWISGRSDLLSAAFMLPSFAFYLFFKETRSCHYLFVSAILFFIGAMAKEVALALPLLIIGFEFLYEKLFMTKSDLKFSLVISACYIVPVIIYFLFFRGFSLDTSSARVALNSTGLTTLSDPGYVYSVLASIGFYVKKLLIPYPLNFAIYRIHEPLYAALGIVALLAFIIWGLIRTSVFSFFAAWILTTVAPAVAAAALKIPWVPWAERYLYLPLVGFTIALGAGFVLLKGRNKSAALLIVSLLACIFWISTMHRNYVWEDETRLWEDTAQKSDYGPVYYFYGKALLSSGREADGIHQLEKAMAAGFGYQPYLIIANIKLQEGDLTGCIKLLKSAVQEYPDYPDIHKQIALSYLSQCTDKRHNKTYYVKAIEAYERYLLKRGNDLDANYRIAMLYRALYRDDQALSYFKKVSKLSPASHYAKNANKILNENRKKKRR